MDPHWSIKKEKLNLEEEIQKMRRNPFKTLLPVHKLSKGLDQHC